MTQQNIIITYSMSEAQRAMLKEALGHEAKPVFLVDQPSGLREQSLVEANALLSWNLPRELGPSEFALLKNAKLIQLISAGVDHVPFNALPPDVEVAGNVGAYAESVAEHALAMTLALVKNLVTEHQQLARGKFNQFAAGRMLRGSICGILGYGGIGRATARLMRGLGVRIYGVNTDGKAEEPLDFVGTLDDLQQVLALSDIVVIALPLTGKTRGLIGKRELGWMKRDAVLINVARGDIIDEGALYEHLAKHPDFKAGIDAWWVEPFRFGEFRTTYPLLALPNVVGSPHNSAMAHGAGEEALKKAAENIKRFLKGEPLLGVARREDYIAGC